MENVRSPLASDEFYKSSIISRLGSLYYSSHERPKYRQLLLELYREVLVNFDFNAEAPEKLRIHLRDTYSHRLLKTALKDLGYRTASARPDCSEFYAIRLKV